MLTYSTCISIKSFNVLAVTGIPSSTAFSTRPYVPSPKSTELFIILKNEIFLELSERSFHLETNFLSKCTWIQTIIEQIDLEPRKRLRELNERSDTAITAHRQGRDSRGPEVHNWRRMIKDREGLRTGCVLCVQAPEKASFKDKRRTQLQHWLAQNRDFRIWISETNMATALKTSQQITHSDRTRLQRVLKEIF